MPKEITNTKGTLLLGMIKKGSDSEHLDLGKPSELLSHRFFNPFYLDWLDHPLAKDFDIRKGEISITVPHVAPGNSYIVVCESYYPHG